MPRINRSQPNPVDVEVGRRIRELRKMFGISQGQLADDIGVTFQQVQKYENGTNRVSASRLVAIARKLGVKPAALLPNDEDDGDGMVKRLLAERAALKLRLSEIQKLANV